MSTEQNKKIVERIFKEGMNQKKINVFDEVLSNKYVNHAFPDVPPGPTGFKGVIQQFFTAFPDMQITLENVIAEGDGVATHGFMSGTHKGEFMGVPASNKKIKMNFVDFWKLSNGQATE